MTDAASPSSSGVTPPGAQQTQFLSVISRDEAQRRFQAHLRLSPPGRETPPLSKAAGRVLCADIISEIDVPAFDRSNVDGFAVCSSDTHAATEEAPHRLQLNSEVLSCGIQPQQPVMTGMATTIATGGMLPRGADAVVMVEHTDISTDGHLEVRRSVTAGENVTFAGTDISRGEMVLRAGQQLTSRELGVLAAIGCEYASVYRQPRVAILSTGDEIVSPGQALPLGSVYDSNAAILSAAIAECGGVPVSLGIVPDDEPLLESALREAMQYDLVLLSGGTSKGAGDLSYRLVSRLGKPGIVAHGVALKPGKPICLAVCDEKPVVILPGFPTSAIFTFHEFVAPVIRALAGLPKHAPDTLTASVPMRINSQRGRTEYLLVSLFERAGDVSPPMTACQNAGGQDQTTHPETNVSGSPRLLVAYPMGKGSGSVTTFSRADGFITIDQQTEILEAGTTVNVTLLDKHLRPADLTVITSHCTGLDLLLSHVQRRGFTLKVMPIGSTGALAAARRGECDLAGIHLLDAESGEYNRPFLTDDLELISGYGRMQCFVFRPGDKRFTGRSAAKAIRAAVDSADCRMVNRNAGSGTRILIDRLLAETVTERSAPLPCFDAEGVKAVPLPPRGRGTDSEAPAKNQGEEASSDSPPRAITSAKPSGYGIQVRSHNAVCAAVKHQRADWGVAIDTVAALYELETIPIALEQFDFVIPKGRRRRPAVQAFIEVLNSTQVHRELSEAGFRF